MRSSVVPTLRKPRSVGQPLSWRCRDGPALELETPGLYDETPAPGCGTEAAAVAAAASFRIR